MNMSSLPLSANVYGFLFLIVFYSGLTARTDKTYDVKSVHVSELPSVLDINSRKYVFLYFISPLLLVKPVNGILPTMR